MNIGPDRLQKIAPPPFNPPPPAQQQRIQQPDLAHNPYASRRF